MDLLRLRVYRLYQPLTLLGMEIWELALLVSVFVLSMQFFGSFHPALSLLMSAVMAGVAYVAIGKLKEVLPGAAAMQYLQWLGQADRFSPSRDNEPTPLIYRGGHGQRAEQTL